MSTTPPGAAPPRTTHSGPSRTPEWTPATALVNGIRLHYRQAGSGPPVVLLHGWPQTGYCWRSVVEPLAADHTVLVPDLRGYGASDKAAGGFDKRTMAADVSALVRSLGFERVAVVGHDRGGRVAHRWALDRPDEVTRLAVLDIAPTRATWERFDADLGAKYWHWLFHLQPDLPERLAGADVEGYLRYFLERWTYAREGLPADAVAEYVRAFSQPGALRCGFDDYRAAAVDAAHDEEDWAAGRRLTRPLLALWGADGVMGQTFSILDLWREYAADPAAVSGRAIERCGHFVPEERPDDVVAELRGFLAGGG
jgi:haloacetate dehalogenase